MKNDVRWRCESGVWIRVVDMTTPHLINAIALCWRKAAYINMGLHDSLKPGQTQRHVRAIRYLMAELNRRPRFFYPRDRATEMSSRGV